MGADQHHDWAAIAASALDWWQDAGVDVLVEDAPRDWLTPPAPLPEPVAAAPAIPAAMPEEIAAFLAWRAGEAVPEAGWHGGFVTASGPIDATVMVLADCPDRDDGHEGHLLAGQAGRLFDRMLAAIGLARAQVHLAAVCAKRPTAGRMPRETEARLGELARHHVALVAPKRLLLLGNAASRAILSAECLEARGILHPFGHKAGETGVVASFHPRFLLEKPAAKAEAWRDLQLLMRGLDT